jgi:hypothetical protein
MSCRHHGAGWQERLMRHEQDRGYDTRRRREPATNSCERQRAATPRVRRMLMHRGQVPIISPNM